MASQTSIVAKQVRLMEWAEQIRDCQNRPRKMDVAAWCAQHGITKANYYYRLKRVRKACLDQYQNNCRQTWCWVLCSAPSFKRNEYKDN